MERDHDALLDFIAARHAVPFRWGRSANDCAAYAIGAILAQSGGDPLPGVTWSSRIGALRVARRRGGFVEIVCGALHEVTPAMAQRGDIAGVVDGDFPGGVRLMVVEGATLVGPGDRGNERQQRGAMIRAWSIG